MNYQEYLKKHNVNFPEYKTLNPASCRSVAIENKYPEFFGWLNETFQGLSFTERMYWFYHNITERPICTTCGKPTKFLSMGRGYQEFCSYKCMNSCKDIQERKKKTSRKNYGVDSPMKSQQVLDKIKSTNLERYGVTNTFQSNELMKRSKMTCIKRYGTEYANQSDVVKQKIWEKKCNIAHDKFNDIIEVKSGNDKGSVYVMKCPDENCTKCIEKKYEIRSDVLRSRLMLHADLCTNRSPVGNHIRNTNIELFIREILDNHSIEYETNNRTILHGKELDIYIPSKKLAIECNGVYWHAMYDSQYHYNKWKQCYDQNIQLLTIWEDWITNKPEIVKSILLSKLGIYEQRIMARQCNVGVVPANMARIFLESNHIQGGCNNNTKLGLYHNDELVALMTFSPASNSIMGYGNNNENDAWVLNRFCTKLNIQVVGGAEKLLKHFLKEHQVPIISFASNDISNGHLYERLGFVKSTVTHTIYWYVHNQTHQRFHRSTFTKKSLVNMGYDPSLTEEQIMMTTDYLRIYDTGLTKYILKK